MTLFFIDTIFFSRQSSSRYAENKPLIRSSQNRFLTSGESNVERNLLTTISSVMQSQSVRVAPPPQVLYPVIIILFPV